MPEYSYDNIVVMFRDKSIKNALQSIQAIIPRPLTIDLRDENNNTIEISVNSIYIKITTENTSYKVIITDNSNDNNRIVFISDSVESELSEPDNNDMDENTNNDMHNGDVAESDGINYLIFQMTNNEYEIPDDKLNDESITTLHFSPLLIHLNKIEIGDECFKYVRKFVIDGLESLKSVRIGMNCFSLSTETPTDGCFQVTNCSNLTELEIGKSSFIDFKSFKLSNLNSLQSIKFGDHCFEYADFSLKSE